MKSCFAGCMRGRTMYVIPYCMGPIDSPYARCGVEITDSAYVVANMYLMTRIGKPALKRIEKDKTFVNGLHSTGDLDPERRYIVHLPEELTIMSFGSGYGGNALLGKKCHALRIASYQARTEGWLAEHMLIVGVQSPAGDIHYLACAFPSACGKTNLAMLIPPESQKGWKVWTLGDDIAWMHLDDRRPAARDQPRGRLFRRRAGHEPAHEQERVRHDSARHDLHERRRHCRQRPVVGRERTAASRRSTGWANRTTPRTAPRRIRTRASRSRHARTRRTPNSPRRPRASRFRAIVFGGRRRELAPLVYQAKDWAHGVLVGASVASETTAAATGKVGVVRRDPMAMKPFCGYNYGDYWAHWLSFAKRSSKLPQIFHVNWFRRDSGGKFLWPGFGDNLRVLRWIIDRCDNRVGADEKPIGFLPKPGDIDLKGLDVSSVTLEQLLAVDPEQWRTEMRSIGEYFAEFGGRLPGELSAEHQKVVRALG